MSFTVAAFGSSDLCADIVVYLDQVFICHILACDTNATFIFHHKLARLALRSRMAGVGRSIRPAFDLRPRRELGRTLRPQVAHCRGILLLAG